MIIDVVLLIQNSSMSKFMILQANMMENSSKILDQYQFQRKMYDVNKMVFYIYD